MQPTRRDATCIFPLGVWAVNFKPSKVRNPYALPWIEMCENPSPLLPPTSRPAPPDTPGVSEAKAENVLAVGRVSRSSRDKTLCDRTFCVSTTGLAPLTVIVSSTDPTDSSTFTAAVKPVVNSIPSRLTVEKPGSVNVTE